MQDKKDRVVRDKCKNLEEEKTTKESSKKNRDDELEKIRKKQKDEDELTKDMFDLVSEISGFGIS